MMQITVLYPKLNFLLKLKLAVAGAGHVCPHGPASALLPTDRQPQRGHRQRGRRAACLAEPDTIQPVHDKAHLVVSA